ncbi:MAG: CHAT domain-containing protein, partial [Deltaproteobacteria bacterium]|nr:CHAT domain-containing protein [Deltaproteobacteria bacterium]
ATASLGEYHAVTLAIKGDLAASLARSGELGDALTLYEEALEGSAYALGEGHPETVSIKCSLASVLSRLGEGAAARELLSEALAEAAGSRGPRSPEAAMAAAALGRAAAEDGESGLGIFLLKLSLSAPPGGRVYPTPDPRGPGRGHVPDMEGRLRDLAVLLAREGRPEEALGALVLLKAEELRGLDPSYRAPGGERGAEARDAGRDAPPAGTNVPGDLLFRGTRDEPALKGYLAAAGLAAQLSSELAGLQARSAEGLLTPYEGMRLASLPEQAGAARLALAEFLRKVPDLPDGAGETAGGVDGLRPSSWPAIVLSGIREELEGPGGGASLVCIVSGTDELGLVTVTPGSVTARTAPTGRAELDGHALEFRDAAGDPAKDPRPAAGRLYDDAIRPAEEELRKAGTGTLLLSLDGELRYVPAAALWDGEMWLGERYAAALFLDWVAFAPEDPGDRGETPVLVRDRKHAPGQTPSETCAGSGSHPGASGGQGKVPGDGKEPGAGARLTSPADGGAAPGTCGDGGNGADAGGGPPREGPQGLQGISRVPGDRLTREAFNASLGTGWRALVTDAAFRMDPASLAGSELVMADGGRLSLREMRTDLVLRCGDLAAFTGTDFSLGASRGDGREVDALGEILLGAGARSVLAAVMPADPGAASELVAEFTRLRYVEGTGAAEALRGAQLKLMRDGEGNPEEAKPATGGTGPAHEGSPLPGPAAGGMRPDKGKDSGPDAAPASLWEGGGYSHPRFWAPFVITGSWR